MPTAKIIKDAKELKGVSVKGLESYWKRAKDQAEKQGHKNDFDYIMQIYKNMTQQFKESTIPDYILNHSMPDPIQGPNGGVIFPSKNKETGEYYMDKGTEIPIKEDKLKGGVADYMSVKDIAKKHNVPVEMIRRQLNMGIKVEYEHTPDTAKAKEIALDHLSEFPDYYTRLNSMEKEGSKAWEGLKEMKLNKPVRTPGESKKFKVYVKGDSSKPKIVRFGDPNLSIKRDNPERRKSFRARHKCDQKTDKSTPGYWACKTWDKNKTVEDVLNSKKESLIINTYMENTMQKTGGDVAYQKHLSDKLRDKGADSINDLKKKERKDLFNDIDRDWKADDEKKESLRNFIMNEFSESTYVFDIEKEDVEKGEITRDKGDELMAKPCDIKGKDKTGQANYVKIPNRKFYDLDTIRGII